ncbi:peptide chain release factor 2 [Candidatus Kuenenbacteria bacterium CG10_big_fil_rev_8_21_14_0_10_36_11]|uniref:Peptide chain release factor 2 n=1 Tax=Candidatus Kuenenbacteria bacterium CG10_big_fil_rev_8_21_14_0_10_36_11 TaxID=1974618 RepID=A0A2M6WAU0_9BACT|nr:MAG: peptide chain release factor 2 [Candidatus Kuenenbacteria bacterium CG10_big_fil_rev_8_21_14_0_10_36_11]
MQDLIDKIKTLQNKLSEASELLNLNQKKQKILALEDQMNESDFWANQNRAKKISQELAELKTEAEEFIQLEKSLSENLAVAEESVRTNDESLRNEIEEKLKQTEQKFKNLEFKIMLSGKYDEHNAVVAIHAGAGGVDAQDWAEMLERMILRYSEKKKFKVNILDRQIGNEAGLKSTVLEIQGAYAYGYLKSEAGVHRLVRISPFDAENMRHTSFVLIEVLPEIEDLAEIELKLEDLIIDTFRSSGKGGQGVNTTDSAVRVRHKPTGIMVTCQNERSQLQNKETALRILKSKIKKYNEEEKEEERQKLRGEFSEATWGNQARSYVLQPYKMVKDHRTDYETSEVEAVLNGEIDELIESYLKKEIKKYAVQDSDLRPSA